MLVVIRIIPCLVFSPCLANCLQSLQNSNRKLGGSLETLVITCIGLIPRSSLAFHCLQHTKQQRAGLESGNEAWSIIIALTCAGRVDVGHTFWHWNGQFHILNLERSNMEWSIGMESRRAHRCYVIVMVWNGMTWYGMGNRVTSRKDLLVLFPGPLPTFFY